MLPHGERHHTCGAIGLVTPGGSRRSAVVVRAFVALDATCALLLEERHRTSTWLAKLLRPKNIPARGLEARFREHGNADRPGEVVTSSPHRR